MMDKFFELPFGKSVAGAVGFLACVAVAVIVIKKTPLNKVAGL